MFKKILGKISVLIVLLIIVCTSAFAVTKPLHLRFFYADSCKQCQYLKIKFLPQLIAKYGQKIVIDDYELTTLGNYQLLLDYEDQTGRTINKTPPLIIIGNQVCEGKQQIETHLETLIIRQLSTGHQRKAFTPKMKNLITVKFNNITFLSVIVGGLIDGINPCAFTVLIFLISYLVYVGRNRHQIFFSGMVYTTGVFISYFFIGLGMLELIQTFWYMEWVSRLFSMLAAGFTLMLGILSFYDYRISRDGKFAQMKLQLNDNLKKKLHRIIRNQSALSRFYLVGVFVIGFSVAIFEFPCTGQVYFPIVLVLRQASPERFIALGYLLIYNLMFIMPLLLIFSLVYFGATSRQLTKFFTDHLGVIKLLTGIAFMCLAVLIILTSF